jgi:hypothetical protein
MGGVRPASALELRAGLRRLYSCRATVIAPEVGLSSKVNKREQRRAERKRSSLIWNVIVLGTLGVALVLIAVYIVVTQRPGALPNETVVPDEGKAVIADNAPLPVYRTNPPSSGTHYDTPAPWGSAAAPVSPGNYLNNLARGGVVFLYRCDEQCAERRQQLEAIYAKAPKESQFNTVKILISPHDGLTSPVLALAWGHEMKMQTADEGALLTWYRRFVNYGPSNGP